MGLSKTEVNLARLLATAPRQRNRAKLLHYVATLREQLEHLTEGLPRVSKVYLNEYSEKIEAIAAKLAVSEPDTEPCDELSYGTEIKEFPSASGKSTLSSEGTRRRYAPEILDRFQNSVDGSSNAISFKLDATAQNHVKKHRKLQEDLTDEMVSLAQKLKDSSLMMNLSIKNTEKILDSTQKAVEHSLAITRHANSCTTEVYSQRMNTTYFTWLFIFAMTCIFIMVILRDGKNDPARGYPPSPPDMGRAKTRTGQILGRA